MVFQFLRRLKRNTQPAEIYGTLVAQARSPEFYADWNVPDTMTGRFDMLVLHVFLFTHRIRDREPLRELGQDIFDIFFQDLDASLREVGIGDLTVPKRLKKMANSFYGQVQVYTEPMEGGQAKTLAEALERNVESGDSKIEYLKLSEYMIAQHDYLSGLEDDDFLRGKLSYVEAGEAAK